MKTQSSDGVAAPMGMRRNVHNNTIGTPLDERIRESRGAPPDDFDRGYLDR
jgi:hypothetical protein